MLDVGAGGLEGENTTEYLLAHFNPENIIGICSAQQDVERYQAQRRERKSPVVEIMIGNFYEQRFAWHQFDLIVMDLNIDNNLFDWSDEGLRRIWAMLPEGGLLINYAMTTDDYGSKLVGQLIRRRWQEFWNTEKLDIESAREKLMTLKGWKLKDIIQEKRRETILWVMLEKTSGS